MTIRSRLIAILAPLCFVAALSAADATDVTNVATPTGVSHGGLLNGQFPCSTGPAQVTACGKTIPAGAVVGTTDTQTLTGKTLSGASNTLSNIPAGALNLGDGVQADGSNNLATTDGRNDVTATSSYAASCGDDITAYAASVGVITFPASPKAKCKITVKSSGQDALIDFNGNYALEPGKGSHNIASERVQTPYAGLSNRNPWVSYVWNKTNWEIDSYSPTMMEAMNPLSMPTIRHGDVLVTHDAGNSRIQMCPERGTGGLVIHAQLVKIPTGCIWVPDSASTSSATNNLYTYMVEAGNPTNTANNGSGLVRVTIAEVSTYPVGSQIWTYCDAIPGTIEADGPWLATVISSTTMDLVGSSFSNAWNSGTTNAPKCRLVGLVFSATGHTNTNGIETINNPPFSDIETFAGTVTYGAAHAYSSLANYFNSGFDFTGAAKSNGDGTSVRAACADLSNAASSCSTDTTNASNISSGTLSAARGGAGTVNGALKADGSGNVSQASAADLSDTTTGTGKITLNIGPTINSPTVSGHLSLSGTALASGDFAFGTGAGTSPSFTSVSGYDSRFSLSFSTGTSPSTSAVVITLTFKNAFLSAPVCFLTAGSINAAAKATAVYLTSTTTTVVLNSTSLGLAASTAYAFNIHCDG